MEKFIKVGRWFYAFSMAAIGFQQFIYGDFRHIILPTWPSVIPGAQVWAWLSGALLIVAAAAIIAEKKARTASLVLGGSLLVLFCFAYTPYEIFVEPYSKHLALWTDALKELALSGGAFVIARTFPGDQSIIQKKSLFIKLLEKIIPVGSIFFSITMISFGIDHFLYTKGVSDLIPNYIADHIFWTYIGAIALISSGVAIILKIRIKPVGILLGVMLFLWFILLHIPRAVNDTSKTGNEMTSAWTGLAFCGIALVIAFENHKEKEPA